MKKIWVILSIWTSSFLLSFLLSFSLLFAAPPTLTAEQKKNLIVNCVDKLASSVPSAKTADIEARCKEAESNPSALLPGLLIDCLPPDAQYQPPQLAACASITPCPLPPKKPYICSQLWELTSPPPEEQGLIEQCNKCVKNLTKPVPSDKEKNLPEDQCNFDEKSKIVTLDCDSWDYAYTECKLPKNAKGAKIADITVKTKRSTSACTINSSTIDKTDEANLDTTSETSSATSSTSSLQAGPTTATADTSSSESTTGDRGGNYGVKDEATMFVDAGCRATFNIKVKVSKCGYRQVCDSKGATGTSGSGVGGGPAPVNPNAMSECNRSIIKTTCGPLCGKGVGVIPESSAQECKFSAGSAGVLKKIYGASFIQLLDKDKDCHLKTTDPLKLSYYGNCINVGVNVDAEFCTQSCKYAGDEATSADQCCEGLTLENNKCQSVGAELRKIADIDIFETTCKAHVGLKGEVAGDTTGAESKTDDKIKVDENPEQTLNSVSNTNGPLKNLVQLTIAKIELLGTFFVVMDESDHKGAATIKTLLSREGLLQKMKDYYHKRHLGLKDLDTTMKTRMDVIIVGLKEYLNLFKISIQRELTAEEKITFEKNEFYESKSEYLANLLAQRKILEAKIAFNDSAIDVSVAFGNDLVIAQNIAKNFMWSCAFKSNCALRTWIVKDQSSKKIVDFYLEPSFAYMAKDPSPIKFAPINDDGKGRYRTIPSNQKEAFFAWVDKFVGYNEYYDFTRNKYVQMNSNQAIYDEAISSIPSSDTESSDIESSSNTASPSGDSKPGMRKLFDFYFKDKPVSDLTKESGKTLFCADENERKVKVPYGLNLGIIHIEELNQFLIDYLDLETKAIQERIKCIQAIYDAAKAASTSTGNGNTQGIDSTGTVVVHTDGNNTPGTGNWTSPGSENSVKPEDLKIIPANARGLDSGKSAVSSIDSKTAPSTPGLATASGSNNDLSGPLGSRNATNAVSSASTNARNAAIKNLKAKLLSKSGSPALKKTQGILRSALDDSFPNKDPAKLASFGSGVDGKNSNNASSTGASGLGNSSGLGHGASGSATGPSQNGLNQNGGISGSGLNGSGVAGSYQTTAGGVGWGGRKGYSNESGSAPYSAQALRADENNFERTIQESDDIWTKISILHERHIKPPLAE